MQTYLVGGAVRDKMLGEPVGERDFVVINATPEEMIQLGFKQVGRDFPVFLHPETHEEYALARTERKTGKGYTAFNCYSSPDVTLEEDLKRRDLTINAMAETLDGKLIDPFQGAQDLKRRLLRHVSPAFAEDPLRILRVARFAARFADFTVHPDTVALMKEIVAAPGEIDALVKERIWKETERALKEKAPARFFEVLAACNALPIIFPPFAEDLACKLAALKKATRLSLEPRVRFAAMFLLLDEKTARNLLHKLKPPTLYHDLALLAVKYKEIFGQALNMSAEELLAFMEKVDLFRKPTRWHELMLVWESGVIDSPSPQFVKFKEAAQAALSVVAKELIAQGYSERSLKDALRQARLAKLAGNNANAIAANPKMTKPAKSQIIIFTGGGSSGHVTPNLALIEKCLTEKKQVFYIGSKHGIEKELIKRINIPYFTISTGKLRRSLDLRNFIMPTQVLLGVIQAAFILRKLRPQVVFSKGGFVGLPVVIAAWLLGIPAIVHESDLTPGLANRLSCFFAEKICLTFAASVKFLNTREKNKAVVTGTPLRAELFAGDAAKGREICAFGEDKKIILVQGGGLGSSEINKMVRALLPQLLKDFYVIHLCGKGKVDSAINLPGYKQFAYVHEELPHLLAAADLVISRAGANSLYELLALKKPHLLLPLTKASRGDQIENARYFSEKGLSMVLFAADLNVDGLLRAIYSLNENLPVIKQRLEAFVCPDAVKEIMNLFPG